MKRCILSALRARKLSLKIGLLAALGLCSIASAPAATITAVDSAGFTNALNSAALGDTIILNAGTTYTGSFNLPNKTTGSGYITIQSSALASLPAAGTRIATSNASNMPKIRATGGQAAITTSPSAHHYKLIGLEIIGPTTGDLFQLVSLGTTGTAQDTLAEVPNNISIQRCIVRANSSTQGLLRGIGLNSASTEILDSRIEGCKWLGQDSQAVCGWNGPGPFNITNNYMEGAGENFMLGGADPSIPNLIPSDITFKRNHLFKPLSWKIGDPSYAGLAWSVKNIFELKSARRAVIEGNIFEHNWVHAQSGYAIVFTPRNQDGGAPWTVLEDIDYRLNILRKSAAGYNIMGHDDIHPSQQSKRIKIENNLNYEIGTGSFTGNGRLYLMTNGTLDTTINHTTCFQGEHIIVFSGQAHTNFVYTNNIHPHNTYGVFGDGQGTGNTSLNTYAPGVTFQKNVLMGGNGTFYNQYPGGWSPTSLAFPASWSGVLVNQASPGSNFAGYKVVNGSAYDNTGTDGKDIGCDIDAVVAATQGCISGVWPGGGGGTTTVTLKNGVGGYNGNVSFAVSGQSPTTNFGPNDYKHADNQLPGANGYVLRGYYKFDVSSIPANAVITSATLQLDVDYSGGSTDANISIHRMKPVNNAFTVNYATATRNTYNGSSAWTGGANAGGDVANSNNDFLDAPDSTTTLPPEGAAGSITFNVASSVQAWVNGEANNGWTVLPSARTVYLCTSADLHGSADFPVLTVTYQSTPQSTTKVLKNGVNGYTGAISFGVDGQNPTSHLGPVAYLQYSNAFSGTNAYVGRAFYRFDLTQGANAIPANAVIDSATLKVKVEYSGGGTDPNIKIHRMKPVNNAFVVNFNTATRNTYNGSSAWTGGANAAGDVANSNNDFLDTLDTTVALPADGQFMNLNVTSSVQAWVNGEANNGWLLLPVERTVYLGTTADLHGSGDYPELTITYH